MSGGSPQVAKCNRLFGNYESVPALPDVVPNEHVLQQRELRLLEVVELMIRVQRLNRRLLLLTYTSHISTVSRTSFLGREVHNHRRSSSTKT